MSAQSQPVLIRDIEDAMLGRIRDAVAPGVQAFGYTIPTVDAYAGQLTEEALARWAPQLPAVFVTYAGEGNAVGDLSGEVWQHPATIWIYCCARSLRREQVAGSGDVTMVGSYQLAADMRRLFIGRRLGLAIMPIQPLGIDLGLQTATLSIIRMGLQVIYESRAQATLPDERPVPFWRMHIDYDLPPRTPVTEPLPLPAADACDELYLEGADL